jgi:hypothetical protein
MNNQNKTIMDNSINLNNNKKLLNKTSNNLAINFHNVNKPI